MKAGDVVIVTAFCLACAILFGGFTGCRQAEEEVDDLCVQFNGLRVNTLQPSVVKIWFQLEDCSGLPLPGKQGTDFVIMEDSVEVSQYESYQTMLDEPERFNLATVLLLDMSGAILESGNLPGLQQAARTFVDSLGNDQEVAIYTFDGRADLQELVAFTTDNATLKAGIDTLSTFTVVDTSTNLNGAVANGISVLDDKRESVERQDILFAGFLAVCTDGTDQAARVSDEELVSIVQGSAHSVFSIGLGGEIDREHLQGIGKNGAYVADDVSTIEERFEQVARDIADQVNSYYLLAYCSPKRANVHEIEVSLAGHTGSLVESFDASGFEGGCTPDDFFAEDYDPIQTIEDSLVAIPGGTFEMGCSAGDEDCDPDEYASHTVTLPSFAISAYEVTQKQWEVVMGTRPSGFSSCGDDCPVESVSWEDVQIFIDALNSLSGSDYRLPTEAEWEYAARAGTDTKWYCGDSESCVSNIAWYSDISGGTPRPVGQKKPNAWGLYDMSGNVYEWCSDWYDSNYYDYSPSDDPQGPLSGTARVYRGGSWKNSVRYCRSSYRGNRDPLYHYNLLGFRLARSTP